MKNTLAFFCAFFICSFCNSQGTWTQKADFGGSARSRAVGFSIGTKGYIGTGYDSTAFKKDFWEWDQSTDTWSKKSDFAGIGRCGAVGFSIGTKGYIGTGMIFINQSYVKDFWEWDQTTDTWTQKADCGNIKRENAIGFSIGTNGYIGTGDDDISLPGAGRNDFLEWNQATDSWIPKSDFGGVKRTGAIGFSIPQSGKGYIGTGAHYQSGWQCYQDFWEWNQTTDTWTQKADFPGGPRRYAVGFSIGSKGYIGTGTDCANNFYRDFWEWDQSTNTWTQLPNVGGPPRAYAVGFSIGNKGYIGLGIDTNSSHISFLKDFWEYSLGSNVNENDSKNHINIFPNPVFSQATLQSDFYFNQATLTIYNLNGKKFKEIKNIKGNKITFQCDNLENGIYFLQLTEKDKNAAIIKLIYHR